MAPGDAQRFISVYDQYKANPDVTARRLYLETMESIMANMNKVLIDDTGTGGAVPYLPLDQLLKQAQPQGSQASPPPLSNSTVSPAGATPTTGGN